MFWGDFQCYTSARIPLSMWVSDRKREDYVYVKVGYQSTLQKIKHYFRRENKMNKNKK